LLLSHSSGSPFLTADGTLVAELDETDDVVLVEPVGADTVQITINNDTHEFARTSVLAVRVLGGGGNDRLEVSTALDISAVLSGGAGDDTVIGGLADDELAGDEGADLLQGEGGDDTLRAEPGDTVIGGDGYNAIVLDVSGTDEADSIALANVDEGTVCLTVNGTTFDFDRRELVAANIDAGAGDDLVELGADVTVSVDVRGGDGNDTLTGGAGNDTLDAGEGSDSLASGGGDDTLFGKPGDAVLTGDGEDAITLRVYGTDGADTIALEYFDTQTTRLIVNGQNFDYDRAELLAAVIDVGVDNDSVALAADVAVAVTIIGGDGDDTLIGGLGAELIDGGAGNDSVTGSSGDDTLFGGDGLDTVNAGAGADFIDGGADADSLEGGDDSDTVLGGADSDTITGGAGADSLDGGLGDPFFDDPSDGGDSISGGDGNDTVFGGAGADTLSGETGHDSLAGNSGDDVVSGGDGDDFLTGGEGNDSIDGGLDFDILEFIGTDDADTILADFSAGMASGPMTGGPQITNGDETESLESIEILSIRGLGGNDSISVGSSLEIDVMLDGGDGDDTLVGGIGNDMLTGGAGNDSFTGGGGYDFARIYGTDEDDSFLATAHATGEVEIVSDSETDTITGFQKIYVNAKAGNDSFAITFESGAPALDLWLEGRDGDDTLLGGPYDDFIYGGAGTDSINAGAGDDILLGASGDDFMDAGDGNDSVIGATGFDTILGGDGDDTILAGDADDSVDAGAGNDLIDGGSGADTILGQEGDDTALGGDGDDSISGGDGNDSILGESGNDFVDGGAGAETIIGGEGDDTLDGQVGNDTIYGGLGNDLISGGDGDDTIGSDQGNDTFFGGNGNDQISGGADDDILDGGEGSDVLDGGAGRDNLLGGQRGVRRGQREGCDNDTLVAGAHDDTLDGGRGRDQLDGGLGTNDLTVDLGRDTIVTGLGVNRLSHINKTDGPCSAIRAATGRRQNRHWTRWESLRDHLTERYKNVASSPGIPRSGPGDADDDDDDLNKANLTITLTSSTAAIPTESGLHYTYTVSNAGPKKAFMVTVYDTFPRDVEILSDTAVNAIGGPVDCELNLSTNDAICDLGTVKKNASASVDFETQVFADPGSVTNTANTTGSIRDPVPADNTSSSNNTVTLPKANVYIYVFDATASEPGTDRAEFSFCHLETAASSVTVNYSTSGTALVNTDYTLSPTMVTLPATPGCVAVTLSPIDDSTSDGTENVTVSISPGTGYVFTGPSSATILIGDDDKPVVTIHATDPNASETGPDLGMFSVSRTGSTSTALTIFYAIDTSVFGAAAPGTDYVALTGQVTLPIGVSAAPFLVTPIDDQIPNENPEFVVARLTPSVTAAYDLGNPGSAQVTITDNDTALPDVSIQAIDPDAAEASPPDTGRFRISRTGPRTTAFSVSLTVSGTAQNGVDYAPINPPATIPTGGASVDITVTPVDDPDQEGDETVVVTLNPSGSYNVGPQNSATVTIADNDIPQQVSLEIVDPYAAESTPPNAALLRVKRFGDASQPLTVKFDVAGTATEGTDYNAIGRSVTVAAGTHTADIQIVPVDDSEFELTEEVIVTLKSDPRYTIIFGSSATVTIEDNDGPFCGNTGSRLVSLEWEKTSSVSPDPGVNPRAIGGRQGVGLRIFPDKNDPDDFPHDSLLVTATLSPRLPGVRIYFKSFDVDDPSTNALPIDPNGSAGLDNFGDPQAGMLSSFSADTGQGALNGIAFVTFSTTKQPGDNFRIAASCDQNEFNKLQVTNAGAPYYVPSTSGQVTGFQGRLTDMLTVWRRLWVETDSMTAVPNPKPFPGRATVNANGATWITSAAWLRPGHSAIKLAKPIPQARDFYEGGKIITAAGEFGVAGNDRRTIVLATVPSPAQQQQILGGQIIIEDDDAAALPNPNLFASLEIDQFRRAYIEPKDANQELPFYTPRRTIPFALNNDSAKYLGAAKDLKDEPWFWTQTLVAAYQPADKEDCDPDGVREVGGHLYFAKEGEESNWAVFGWTFDKGPDLSAIYLETVRDCYPGGLNALNLVVSHETGHGPGLVDDHPENRLMAAGGQEPTFNEISLERLRKTSRWYGPPVRALVQPRRGPM
jgi:uncharacterized repeat protein (TIGR01451 family)